MEFAVIFDMDGTLFQTEKVLIPSLHKTFNCLKKEGNWKGDTPVEEYLQILGVTLQEVWRRLLPNANEKVREYADKLFLDFLIKEINSGNGELYSGVKEVIDQISKMEIPMFIASNGLEAYIQAICHYYELENDFKDQYSAGRFHSASKSELVQFLISKYQIEKAVMVGDRHSDIHAGKQNGLWTIGCQFGFANENELVEADYVVREIKEIIPIIKNLN